MAITTEYILSRMQVRELMRDDCHGDPPWFTEADDVRVYRRADGRCEMAVNGEDTGILSDPGAYDTLLGIAVTA